MNFHNGEQNKSDEIIENTKSKTTWATWNHPLELWNIIWNQICPNLNLGFATKARGCKVTGEEGSSGVMPHAPRSARECEGIGPHTPNETPTLGIWILMDSRMFREW